MPISSDMHQTFCAHFRTSKKSTDPKLLISISSLQMNLTERRNAIFLSPTISIFILIIISLAPYSTLSIRFPDQISEIPKEPSNRPLKTVIFALGSFWRSEAVFGCLDGVVRTTAGYAGGSKLNPEYRSLGDHAESVQVTHLILLVSA